MSRSIISTICSQFPLMMGGISIFLLSFIKKQNIWWISLYIAGFIGNELLNRVLKPILQDHRPIPISSTDKYGMPSGHSQLAAYSLVFMSLLLRKKHYGYYDAIILLFIFLTIATMIQRVATKVHSLEQVIVGGLLGGGIGYILQKFASSIFARKEKSLIHKTDL